MKLHIQTSTKADGNMMYRLSDYPDEVTENRASLLGKFGLGIKDCVVMDVQHGDDVTEVTSANRTQNPTDDIATEAFITNEKNVVLFLMTADCLPAVLYDPKRQVLALAHLGRKPTEQRLLPKVINSLKECHGSLPEDLEVNIGPGIHRESYLFVSPLRDPVVTLAPFITSLPSGELSVDLVGANIAQMIQSGVRKENIVVDPDDTAISPVYFSHYSSARTGEPEGRFATIAWLE